MAEDDGNGNRRSIPEMSVDTRLLIERLSRVEIGDFVSYKELSEVIGRDVQGAARGNLTTARHRLEVDDAIQFGPVVGKGLTRLDALGVMGGSDGRIRHCNRTMNKEARRLARIDPETVPKEKRPELHIKAAHVQILGHLSKPKTQKKLEAKLAGSDALPMAKLLEAVRETL